MYQTVKKEMRRRADWIEPIPPAEKAERQALVMQVVQKHQTAMISTKTDHSAPKVAKAQVQDSNALMKEKERMEREEEERRAKIKENIVKMRL